MGFIFVTQSCSKGTNMNMNPPNFTMIAVQLARMFNLVSLYPLLTNNVLCNFNTIILSNHS